MTRREIAVGVLIAALGVAATALATLGDELFPGYRQQMFVGAVVVAGAAVLGLVAMFIGKRGPKPINKRAIGASWMRLSADLKKALAQDPPTSNLAEQERVIAGLTRRFEKRLKQAYDQMLALGLGARTPPYPLDFTERSTFFHWKETLRDEGRDLINPLPAEQRDQKVEI